MACGASPSRENGEDHSIAGGKMRNERGT